MQPKVLKTCCCHGYSVAQPLQHTQMRYRTYCVCFRRCAFHLFICAVAVRSMFSHGVSRAACSNRRSQSKLYYTISRCSSRISNELFLFYVFVFFLRFISHSLQVCNCRTPDSSISVLFLLRTRSCKVRNDSAWMHKGEFGY